MTSDPIVYTYNSGGDFFWWCLGVDPQAHTDGGWFAGRPAVATRIWGEEGYWGPQQRQPEIDLSLLDLLAAGPPANSIADYLTSEYEDWDDICHKSKRAFNIRHAMHVFGAFDSLGFDRRDEYAARWSSLMRHPRTGHRISSDEKHCLREQILAEHFGYAPRYFT